jgi:hypothetical protein
MPSIDHEITLELLRQRPSIVAELVQAATGISVTDALTPRAETFAQLDPAGG